MTFEYMVEQEIQAEQERSPFEPVLPFVQRLLREGKRKLSLLLLTARPLHTLPTYYNHEVEVGYIEFLENDNRDQDLDLDEIQLDLSWDLTDEELTKIYDV